MTDDDIVIRLRRNAEAWKTVPEAAQEYLEAADEIARLRRELARKKRGLEVAIEQAILEWQLYHNSPRWRGP